VLTPRPLAYDIVRQLSDEAREFPGCLLQIKAHPQVTQILQEESGPLLNHLAKDHQVQVDFSPQPQFARDHYVISRELPG
jgi:hypothetical protein